jgi:hypothetical protein
MYMYKIKTHLREQPRPYAVPELFGGHFLFTSLESLLLLRFNVLP